MTRSGVVAPVLVGLVALAGYARTVMPGVGYWDTAEFQTVLPTLGIAHPTGFPTYVILGWLANAILAPLGEPALRMNVLSAILVAAAAGSCVVLVRRLTGSVLLGVAAGLGLAATPIAWGIATHADPHALHLLLVGVLLVLLAGWEDARSAGARHADRWLVAATLVFGLSAGNHSLTLLIAVPVGLFVLAVDPQIWQRRIAPICLGVLTVTVVLLYLELPIRSGLLPAPLVYGSPDTWEGFRYIVLAEQFRGSFVDPTSDPGARVSGFIALAEAQFGRLALLVPVGFVATLARRPRYALLSGMALLITVVFSAFYINADIGRYYLGPALIAWTWLAILGRALVDGLTGLAHDAEPEIAGSSRGSPARARATRVRHVRVAATAMVAVALIVPTALAIPARLIAADRSGDPGSRPWLDATMAAIDPDAVIVSWWSYSTALWYAQVIDGQRPDVWIVDDRTRIDQALGDVIDVIDANFATRPVYLIRSDPREIVRLREHYVVERVGDGPLIDVFRVISRAGAAR